MKKTLDTSRHHQRTQRRFSVFCAATFRKNAPTTAEVALGPDPHPKTARGLFRKRKRCAGANGGRQDAGTRPNKQKARTEGTNEATKQRFTERTVKRPFERTKIRHTFDVFADQVTSLKHIQLEREETFAKRYLLGELVQEALDLFITRERKNE